MSVKIISDKTLAKIMDSDTGDRIKGIGRIEITHDIGSRPEVELHIVSTEQGKYNVEADETFWVMSTVDGEMKQVKSIEFLDGQVIDYGGSE